MTADVGERRHHSGKVHHARRAAREVQTRSACEGSIFNQDRDRRGARGGAGEKNKTPRPEGTRGFIKKRENGQTARLTYLASMYFATWALARLAALRCTTPDLMALSIAEA